MRADDLAKVLKTRPFQPVRLHISSGEHVDVLHPELAIVTRSLVTVAVGKKPGGVPDYPVHYNLLHVVKEKPLNGHRGKNGASGRRKE